VDGTDRSEAAPWPFGDYPPGGIERLSPHVTAFYSRTYPLSNAAIVQGTDQTLLFDAAMLAHARQLRTRLAELGGAPLHHLLLSHVHNDHAHGAMHFSPPARVWAHPWTQERLRHWSERDLAPFVEEAAAVMPELVDEYREVSIVVPDETIAEPREFDLGGGVRVSVQVAPTAHTPGDLWALVEPDGIALCGDLWFNDCEPYIGHGSANGSLEALARIRETRAASALPGHGRAARLPEAGADAMERYCRWVLDAVTDGLEQGLGGLDLKGHVRAAFDLQADRSDGIGFSWTGPDFLEDNVEAVEQELRTPS
jgi:glyoxylase-like metal-dependent hydrolase (beta-lactamase superfamily II)